MKMVTDAVLIADILSLPKEKKAEIAKHVQRLKEADEDKGANKHPRRRAGSMLGAITIAPDFDEPLEDFEDYM